MVGRRARLESNNVLKLNCGIVFYLSCAGSLLVGGTCSFCFASRLSPVFSHPALLPGILAEPSSSPF